MATQFRMPKLRYLAIAVILAGIGYAFGSDESTQSMRRLVGELQNDLGYMDPFQTSKVFYAQAYNKAHGCTSQPSCRQVSCEERWRGGTVIGSNEFLSLRRPGCASGWRSLPAHTSCLSAARSVHRTQDSEAPTIDPRSFDACYGVPPELVCSAPVETCEFSISADWSFFGTLWRWITLLWPPTFVSMIWDTITQTWSLVVPNLSWLGFGIFIVALVGAFLAALGLWIAWTDENDVPPALGFLAVPLATPAIAGVFAWALKWLLYAVVAVFGAAIGLIVWAFAFIKIAMWLVGVWSSARDIEEIAGDR